MILFSSYTHASQSMRYHVAISLVHCILKSSAKQHWQCCLSNCSLITHRDAPLRSGGWETLSALTGIDAQPHGNEIQ